MKNKRIIALLLSVIISSAVFFALGLLFVPSVGRDSSDEPAGENLSGVDYYTPENAKILFLCPDGSGALCLLDFENSEILVTLYANHALEQVENDSGGEHYTANMTVDFLALLADRVGGIELYEGGGKRRYFSAGLRQKLSEKQSLAEKREMTLAFFEKIAKLGLSSEDFKFIIEERK